MMRTIVMRLAVAAACACALLGGVESARAQQLLDSYVAYIGPEDVHNSRGVRLRNAPAILRQDRANFHRYGIRHAGDQPDDFFGDINNRATFERWLARGSIAPYVARQIVSGGVWVIVDIYGYGNVGEYVTVRLM